MTVKHILVLRSVMTWRSNEARLNLSAFGKLVARI
jgi:hypothetical protein